MAQTPGARRLDDKTLEVTIESMSAAKRAAVARAIGRKQLGVTLSLFVGSLALTRSEAVAVLRQCLDEADQEARDERHD